MEIGMIERGMQWKNSGQFKIYVSIFIDPRGTQGYKVSQIK